MTPEQQRKMLECAVKACGVAYKEFNSCPIGLTIWESDDALHLWNPFYSSSDCAEMCAKLALDTAWGVDDVIVMVPEEEAHEAQYKDHDNSRLKAWMYAATIVAAKIGGMK